MASISEAVIPAKAGIQSEEDWVPAFAGTTSCNVSLVQALVGTPGRGRTGTWRPFGQSFASERLVCIVSASPEYKIVTGLDEKGKTDNESVKSIPLRGELTRLFYENPRDRSTLEVIANYKEGLQKAGFEILFECAEKSCTPAWASSRWSRINGMKYVSSEMRYLAARRGKEGQESYVAISIIKARHEIDILQTTVMETGLVTISAEQIEQGLMAEGSVVLEGVYFDHDKATIKPESKPALEVIAGFLRDHAAMKAFVVGHTDTTGSLDHNMNLSRQRAQAIADTLTKEYGIAADRLSEHGVGPLAPKKANRTEDGKAQNRRVELVER